MSILDHGFMAKSPYAKVDQGKLSIFHRRRADEILFSIDESICALNKPVVVDANEVNAIIDSVHALADREEGGSEGILEPVLLGLIDGCLRSFNFGNKTGVTATRIYRECKNFSYTSAGSIHVSPDSMGEFLDVQRTKKSFGKQVEYKDGVASRNGEQSVKMRDQKKMAAYKEKHFSGNEVARDEYDNSGMVFVSQHIAKEKTGMLAASAEVDHVKPCKQIVQELSENLALKLDDVKNIANDDSNFAVTSKSINASKGDSDNKTATSGSGKCAELPESAKKSMCDKAESARKSLEKNANAAVVKNLRTDRDTQTRVVGGAMIGASLQSFGDAVIYVIKPFIFELRDCVINGFVSGVTSASSLGEALRVRFGRLRDYVLKNVGRFLSDEMMNFFKSFLSILVETVLNCFYGILKSIMRALKEGLRVAVDAVQILRGNGSSAEKGDAILKLLAASSAAIVGISIDTMLGRAGLPEPLSVIISSMASAGIMAVVLVLLEHVDIFNVKVEMRRKRILEIFDAEIDRIDQKVEQTSRLISATE